MIKYIPAHGNLIKLNVIGEDITSKVMPYFGSNIDYAYFIDEDGTFEYDNMSYSVKSGQIILVLYSEKAISGKNRVVVIVDSPEWVEHNKKYLEWENTVESRSNCNCCKTMASEEVLDNEIV